MLEMQEDQNHNPYEEIDPSYASYVTGQELYSEYQYLFQYGGEDTNAQEMPEDMAGDQSVQTVQEGNDGGILSPSLLQSNGVHIARQGLPVVGTEYVMEQLADYDFLMKHFYSVHASTTATREQMDAEKMLEDLTMPIEEGKPQILIYHTHSQEAFADSGPGETVVGMGSYLTELLEAKGYTVIHDTSVYDLRGDVLDRNKAYSYAEEGIARILQENPSIQVVLDLHRDGVNEKLHLVSEVNGKPTAQIMFFNGMSQTPEGPIEYLPNPYRKDNLAFSFQMQLNAAAYYPGLTRKIYLKGLRYNMHYRPRSALVEVGAQTNTYQEALNAMEPLAELLDMVLQGH
ncbi:MAG: stage II sporulation protein P [Lachnospiraceae bacterium]